MSGSDIVKSVGIDNLLGMRDGIVDRLAQAKDLIDEAASMLAGAGMFRTKGMPYELSDVIGDRRDCLSMLDPEWKVKTTSALDSFAWAHLMNESGLRTFMCASARREWDDLIYACRTPPLTLENIQATFQGMHAARFEMMERGVCELYRKLSWDYKTNNPRMFGKRLILRSFMMSYCNRVNWHSANELDDLIRFFHFYDGKAEPDHRKSHSELIAAAGQASGTVVTEYLHIQWFKNGNAHITFLRADLVEKLNGVLAKHHPLALPPL